ncbi:hypothetical protein CHS0354_035152 [Potamilus streckersoni]|uniref:IRS-type PTB domain-containing protein n=1 Tax=Potamilus streckersoni TaxID=2493646 RepID=A0AAE0WD71_9BIVA|nr:hypothetical protein CHS0354_035152 [Potamilus streckersoni]
MPGRGSSTPLTSKSGKYKRTQVDETPTRLRPMTPVEKDSGFLELLGNDEITFTENHENDMYSELGRNGGIQPALKRSNSLSLLEEPLSQDLKRSSTFSSRGMTSTQGTSVAASNRTSAIYAPNIVVTLNNADGTLVNLFEPVEETRAELYDENMDKNRQSGADTGEEKYKPTPSSMFEVQADVHQDGFEDVTSLTLNNMNQTNGKSRTVPQVRSISDSIVEAKMKDLAVQSEALLDNKSSSAKLLSDEISEDQNSGDMFCVEVMDNEVSKRCNLSGHYTLNVTFEGLALLNEDGPLFCWLYKELEGFGFVKERDIFRFKSICSSQSGTGMFCFLTEKAEEINKSVTAHATPNCQLKVRRNSDHKSHSNFMELVMKNLKKIRFTNLQFMKKRNKISVSVISDPNIMPMTDVYRKRKKLSPFSDTTHQHEEMGV